MAAEQIDTKKRSCQWVTKREGAAIFKMSTRAFDKLRQEDERFPSCVVLGGRKLRWVESELEAYARERQLPCAKAA